MNKIKLFFICIYNYFLCLKYPFYKMYTLDDGRFLGYDVSWYHVLLKGWRKAFGKQLSKDLKKQLKIDKALSTFRFIDIKEKYGQLTFAHLGCSEATQAILDKYELLSIGYCQYCGKPARYKTKCTIGYYCGNCPKSSMPKFRSNCLRLSVEDIPIVTVYEDSKTEYKTTYGIDFFKLWNIDKADFYHYLNNLFYEKCEITKEDLTAYQKWFIKFVSKKKKKTNYAKNNY